MTTDADAAPRQPRPGAEGAPRAAAQQPPRPFWIPPGVAIEDWPAGLRAAVAAIINPIYTEFVLRASPGLRQSTGLTIVHLLWLEILDQVELGRQAGGGSPVVSQSAEDHEARATLIARHLRLVNAKLKASEFFTRLDELKFPWRPATFPKFDDPLKPEGSPAGPEHGKSNSC